MAKKDETTEIPLSFEERQLLIQERQLALAERQAAQQERAIEVQAAQLKQTAAKSLTVPARISAFNPRGEKDYPMPLLKCDVYMPFKLSPQLHSLDREEVELFNLIEPGDDYLIELTDGAMLRVCVLGVRNHASGALESLTFKGPKDDTGVYAALFTNENKQVFPALKAMLRQMLGESAASVQTMRAEIEQIKRGELAVSVGA